MRFNSPMMQVLLVGFACFCCPGMFNVINSLGAGGQMDDNTAKNGNVALYACFAVFGVFGGAIHNILGSRWTMVCGGLTYALYSGSLVYYSNTHKPAFVIIASAILGIGAGMFWTAQGTIMMSYPSEDQKGRAVGIFWIIFNLGSVLGSFIPFGLNFHSTLDHVSTATYYVLMVIMIIGALLGFGLIPPEKVVREDGTRVQVSKFHNAGGEIIEILKLFKNKNMLLLFPMFISSNWFYSYQFGAVNGVLFNVRTRSFNNAFYWGSQMIGAYGMGWLLDNTKINRRTRALYGLTLLAILATAVWGGGLALQLQYTRENHPKDIDFINGPGWGGKFVLYLLYGLVDAVLQTYAYWLMGALSNDTHVLARYAGYYKGIQSAGGAISWDIDAKGTGFLVQLIINWALCTVAFPFSFLVAKNIKDTTDDSDEKAEIADC
ncbi:MFS general substrate transporter [Basidiobolus meristosporus CBS 931.73]|uniref:MFS general substrate transporter n=1 Tax=Basidiobolus meristosporus CBS 931.73 TaxID=1314790 RepID=A0A1Y1YYE4_9FUNG|nr:MFS general substrate transporter [Basidiobolus meristosporus CBS 931.73]|eukprot:ORY02727.1 MFS general substrate transporter [Basidiobolus meristosporus CBS 931.73]